MCNYWVVCNVLWYNIVGWWDTPTILRAKCRQFTCILGLNMGQLEKILEVMMSRYASLV
jgi:uncharacterized membrane protein YccF (DUF307 family)